MIGVIERVLHAATRAPSVHNTQPWLFVVAPSRIELYLDRERVLPVADPDAREAQLSCGAALFNLTVALRAAGQGVVTALVPDPDRPDILARVRVGGDRPASAEVSSLAGAIDGRATNRRPFHERAVPLPHRRVLAGAAEAEGAALVMLDSPRMLDAFAGLLRRADHLQEEDRAFQVELREWTTGEAGRPDGVPRSAGGPRPVGGTQLTLRRRFHDTDAGRERSFAQEPLVAVLAAPGDTVRDRLRAGQALQRVLLSATASGLSASFLSQPVEVPYIRAALRGLLAGRQHPQTVLRIGYGDPATPTPRRAITDVARYVSDIEERR
jgi:nitroreductase